MLFALVCLTTSFLLFFKGFLVENQSTNEKNKKKFFILFNPSSGRGKALEKKDELLQLLENYAIDFELHQTASEEDLRLQVFLRAKEFTCIVAAGGDSTLAIIIEELRNNSLTLPVAIIPVGTSDDIARQWGIVSMEDAVRALQNYKTAYIDLLRLESYSNQTSHRLMSTLGQANIGLGALVNFWVAKFYRIKIFKKIPESIVGFFTILFLTAFKRLSLKVTLTTNEKSQEIDCSGIVFTSIRYWVKGLHFSPDSKCDDGLLEAVIIRRVGFFSMLKIFLRSRNGEHLLLPFVDYWQSQEFTVTSLQSNQKFLVQADGEILMTEETNHAKEKKELYLSQLRVRARKKFIEAVMGNIP